MSGNLRKINNIDMLDQAFQAFSLTTSKFQEAYQKLEDKVAFLSQELAKKNEALNRNVIELEKTRQYVNNILESISDGVIALDLEGSVTTVNKAAKKITGYSSEELLHKNFKELFITLGKYGNFIEQITQGKMFPAGQEIVIKSRSGETIPVIAYTSLITDEFSEVIGIVITFNDLTKIKKLEDEIERSKRLASLGEMAAGVAHEIRNPLGGVEMFASILDREFREDVEKKKITENIISGVQSINKIISELLTFTRSFNKTNFEKVDIIDCLENALVFVSQEIERKRMQLQRSYDRTDSLYVYADKDQLQQVLLNLFLNAIQASEPGEGILAVKYYKHPQEPYAIIEIRDNGSGIKKKDLGKIFDPFFTTKQKGTGLGLAISYRIVEAHKGTIRVQSRENHGSVFSVLLPLEQER